MAVKVYNVSRNHLRDDGKQVILKWGFNVYPVPPKGEAFEVEDIKDARRLVANHVGFSLTPPVVLEMQYQVEDREADLVPVEEEFNPVAVVTRRKKQEE